jgi:hypothetical protein
MPLFGRRRPVSPYWHEWWRVIAMPVPRSQPPPDAPPGTVTAELIEGVFNAWAQHGPLAWRKITNVMEEQLANPDEVMAREIGWFCEVAQNGASWGCFGFPTAAELSSGLGPNLRSVWDTADAYWASAEAAPAEPEDVDVTQVENRQLRALLMADIRNLPGGGQVRLGQIVRSERSSR